VLNGCRLWPLLELEIKRERDEPAAVATAAMLALKQDKQKTVLIGGFHDLPPPE
jgi:hypothetical protein